VKFTELLGSVGTVGDPARSAEAVATELKLNARQREALFPLIAAECERIDRNRVRNVEQSVNVGRRVDPTAERADLMRETFTLGSGERIPWGSATVEQHLARIEYLSKYRDGINATIGRHQAAVDRLLESGAKCLDEIVQVAA
jgi:hypothetical protein